MFEKVLLTLFLIFNAYDISMSYKYSLALQDEEIFMRCNTSGVYFSDRFLDMSDMKYEFLANGSIHAHGSALFTRDLGTDHVGQDRASLQVFKKDRDRWSPTIYNLSRPDLCKALFNPTELWSKYTRNISKENRKCPFFVGQNLTFDNISDLDITVPDPNLAGNYMIVIMIHFKGVDEHVCVKMFGEIYRS